MKRQSLPPLLSLLAIVWATGPALAAAAPHVTLKLIGSHVTVVDGHVKHEPVENAVLKAGDDVEYDIVASNTGTRPAFKLIPMARVPAGTEYVAGSAKGLHATPQFSLDGGKTWSAAPTVTEKTSAGTIARKADAALYTAVRFVADGPLAPGARATYSYEVRVR
jgi:uncharacterized repeat protein (TIGR01451 family)